jgi:hypothetical protein
MDRRSFGVKVAAGAAVAWVAPTVISVRAAEAATCPPPPGTPPPLETGPNTTFITPPAGASTTNIQNPLPPPPPPPPPPPTTVVFAESGPVTLPSDLAIDRDGSPGANLVQPYAGATLPAGTVVYSYLVHARLDPAAPSAVFQGSLQVPPSLVVLGFAATTNATQNGILESTNFLGRADMTYRYLSVNGEGTEPGTATSDGLADSITIGTPDATGTAVSWHLFTGGSFSDEFRLLLGAAPC